MIRVVHLLLAYYLHGLSHMRIEPSKLYLNCSLKNHNSESFFKIAQARGRTWDLLVLVYFPSIKQRHRPFGYCPPVSLNCFKADVFFFSRLWEWSFARTCLRAYVSPPKVPPSESREEQPAVDTLRFDLLISLLVKSCPLTV